MFCNGSSFLKNTEVEKKIAISYSSQAFGHQFLD